MSDQATTSTDGTGVVTPGTPPSMTADTTGSTFSIGGQQFTLTPGNGAPPDTEPDLLSQAQKFTNDPAAIAALLAENFKERDRRRKVEAERDEALAGRPGEDQVVLSKKDAEALAAWKELGKMDEVKGAVQQFPELQQQLAAMQRQQLVQRASSTADGQNRYKAHVLAEVLGNAPIQGVDGDDGWELHVGVPVEGQDEPEFKPIQEYLDAHKADFLPAILVGEAQPPAAGVVGASRPGQKTQTDYRTADNGSVDAALRSKGVFFRR